MYCKNCDIQHNGKYGSGKFCGAKCARSFSTKNKRNEINKKVSEKMSGRKLTEEHISNIEKTNNFNRKQKIKKNCLHCNQELLLVIGNKQKFCSQKCWISYTEKNKEPYLLYRQKSKFDFDPKKYPDKFDLELISKHGWYSPSNKGNNLNGVSKDHMLSVKEGFELGVDPSIIKHPANCKIMLHKENQNKNKNSSITLNELMERIKNW
jgi:hypothetical protein